MDNHIRGKLIAISLSTSEDLEVWGKTDENLNQLCLHLSRDLLRRGARLAYGGVLGVGTDFTETLSDVAELGKGTSSEVAGGRKPPFVSYQPWPWCLEITEGLRAKRRDSCEYICVSDEQRLTARSAEDWENARRSARSTSRMRKLMAADTDARVLIGGRTTDFAGLMPGIFEEALFHLEFGKPIYLVGGFGGATNALAKALRGETVPQLALENRQGKSDFHELVAGFATQPVETPDFRCDVSRDEASRSYERLQDQVTRIRGGLAKGLQNGLDDVENTTLMNSATPDEISNLVIRGLTAKESETT